MSTRFFHRIRLAAAAALGVGFALCGVAAERAPEIRNYVLYYGAVESDEAFRQLGAYDMIVIDPQALGARAKEWIAGWKREGRTVIGYLSCMEVASWHRYRDRTEGMRMLEADGRPFRPFGDNRVMDLTDPAWRQLVAELVGNEVLDYGCDGVFMDTLADIEHPELPPTVAAAQLEGLDALLKLLRERYPDTILIANWTIGKTMPVAAKYVDMICWENCNPAFFADGNPAAGFMRRVRDAFRRERAEHRFRVLALWAMPADAEAPETQRRLLTELARQLGYLSYVCCGDYHCGFTPLEPETAAGNGISPAGSPPGTER